MRLTGFRVCGRDYTLTRMNPHKDFNCRKAPGLKTARSGGRLSPDLFGCTLANYVTALVATFGAQIDYVISWSCSHPDYARSDSIALLNQRLRT
jgi:hypothetical protein